MEVSREKNKTMTNRMNNISADISMNGKKLEEMTSFKYLGAKLCKDGTCSAEVRIRIASAKAAMVKQDLAVQHHQFASKLNSSTSLLSPPSSSSAVKH